MLWNHAVAFGQKSKQAVNALAAGEPVFQAGWFVLPGAEKAQGYAGELGDSCG